jgi:hypothetical protein
VFLDATARGYGAGGTVYQYRDYASTTNNVVYEFGPDEFSVDASIGDILRVGSVIIDADVDDLLAPDITNSINYGSGEVYKVIDRQSDGAAGRWLITLDRRLENDLASFWVFPPAIVRTGSGAADYEFEDSQPVIDFIKVKVDF